MSVKKWRWALERPGWAGLTPHYTKEEAHQFYPCVVIGHIPETLIEVKEKKEGWIKLGPLTSSKKLCSHIYMTHEKAQTDPQWDGQTVKIEWEE